MTMTAKTALTMELTPRVSARFSVRFSALPSLHQRGLGAAEMQSALPQRSADGRQGRLGVGPPLLRRQCSGQDLVAAMIVVGSDDVVCPAARRLSRRSGGGPPFLRGGEDLVAVSKIELVRQRSVNELAPFSIMPMAAIATGARRIVLRGPLSGEVTASKLPVMTASDADHCQ